MDLGGGKGIVMVTLIAHHTLGLMSWNGTLWMYMGFILHKYQLFWDVIYLLRWNQVSLLYIVVLDIFLYHTPNGGTRSQTSMLCHDLWHKLCCVSCDMLSSRWLFDEKWVSMLLVGICIQQLSCRIWWIMYVR
jgi:hypothetical protein